MNDILIDQGGERRLLLIGIKECFKQWDILLAIVRNPHGHKLRESGKEGVRNNYMYTFNF